MLEEGEERRQQSIRITEEGVLALHKSLPLWEGVQESLINELGEKRIETLLGDLQNLTEWVKRK